MKTNRTYSLEIGIVERLAEISEKENKSMSSMIEEMVRNYGGSA